MKLSRLEHTSQAYTVGIMRLPLSSLAHLQQTHYVSSSHVVLKNFYLS